MKRLPSAAIVILLLGLGSGASAQISPGPLSRSHANLGGSSQCLRCHDPKTGVSPEKCLECHSLLRQRIASHSGLHARSDYRDCKRCHVDHQGAEAELIWWGPQGRESFDHALTGYVLAGAHARQKCDACHRRHLKTPRADLERAGADPARTYLGLAITCESCHRDVHRGRFAGHDCASCHTVDSWTQVTRFDHELTAYPLTGAHRTVTCDRCHPTDANAKPPRRRYRGIAYDLCTDCHRDPHAGRLGTTCASCHATAGWSTLDQARFDHSKTSYPLEGRHRRVACAACHITGKPLRLKHDRCSDCHADAHFGQLAHRADRGRCEACHSVEGFVPVRFSIEDHARTRYPLKGAHLAVPCNGCHRVLSRSEVRRLSGRSRRADLAPVRLRFTSFRCRGCHRDPHAGDLQPKLAAGGCESCHRVASWDRTTFDHGRTSFPLTGRHATVACAACHRRADTRKRVVLMLRLPSQSCDGCHRDPHQGQFKKGDRPQRCERCHTTGDWRPTRFDHARETGYALDGAHARLACNLCHKRHDRGSSQYAARLPTTCVGCHGSSRPRAKENP